MKKIFTLLLSIIAFQAISLSQNWNTLADVPVGLAFPVVAVLNGEIHVIGGGAPGGATQLHLRYKPFTNTWDTLADVPYKAQQPAGAVVDGKIHYFGGGYPNSGTPLDDHYVYDPSNDSWSAAQNLPIPRVIMKAAVLDGKIFAMSGQPEKARVDVYDPNTNSWSSKNPLPDNNFWYSAIVVVNNEMFRFGGGGFTSPVNTIQKYNATGDSWTNIGNLPSPLHAPAGTVLGGKIYIAGGYYGSETDTVYEFNPLTYSLNKITALPAARAYHELVTIDSCIYSIGGNNPFYPDMNVSFIRICNPVISSILDNDNEQVLSVYPNPAKDHILIDTKEELDFVIFDATGSKILNDRLNTGRNIIDISNFISGIYFYKVLSQKDKKNYQEVLIVIP